MAINSYATGPVNADHSSYDDVGGLIGRGRAQDSYATGNVTAPGAHSVGGLVGEGGQIIRSYATGAVSAYREVGGLVGNGREIISSHATGNVTASGDWVGGLIGRYIGDSSDSSNIANSYATGTVSGASYVGGLLGGFENYDGYPTNSIAIRNSYATGNVTGGFAVGGLVGRFDQGVSSIQNSYASGAVNGDDLVGGLVGQNDGSISNSYATGSVTTSSAGWIGGLVGGSSSTGSVVNNSFWDTTTTGQATSTGGTGMTTAQMKTLANFNSATADNGNTNPGWDISANGGETTVWRIYEGQTYPVLRDLQHTVTVTANNAAKTYDGNAYTGGNGVTYSTSTAPLSGSISYGGTAQGAVNAGSYAIAPAGLTLNRSTQADYQRFGDNIVYTNGTLTIDPAVLTAITGNLTGTVSKTYDGSTAATLAAGNFLLTGWVGSDGASVTKTTGTYDNANAGTSKTVTVTLSTGDYSATGSTNLGNYDLPTSISGTVGSILARPITVTANNQTRSYGGTNPSTGSTSLTTGTLVGSDALASATLSAAGTASATANAGTTHALTPSAQTFSTGNAANYAVSYADGTLTITPAPLTVTANNASQTYNGVAYSGGNGVSYSGFVNSETAAVLTGTLAYGGTSQGAVNAGNYTISPSGLTSGNYTIAFNNGTLTINPATITGNLTGSVSKTYNGSTAATLAAGNYQLSGWVGSDGAGVSKTTGAYDNANAGSNKTVTVTLTTGDYSATGSTNLSNYTLPSSVSGNVGVINQAPLTVTANSASKTYNGVAYSGGNGVSYSGFVNSETAAVLTGTLAYGGTSQGAVNAGNYTISPSGLTSGNYTIAFNNGTLTIDPAALTAITGNLSGTVSKTYDGSTAATLAAGNFQLTGWAGSDGASVTKTTGTYDNANAGTSKTVIVTLTTGDYSATGSTNLGNYTLPTSISGTVGTILARPITVTANNQTRNYGGTNPSTGSTSLTTGTLAGSDALASATLSAAGSASATANAGTTHALTPSAQTFSTGNAANYAVSYADGTLTITPAPLTVTANNASQTYNGVAYSGGNGVSYSGFVNSETAAVLTGTLAYGGTSQGAVNAGNYTISPSGLTSGNYTIAFNNGTLTIDPATISGNLTGSVSKTYDGTTTATLAAGNYQFTGWVGSDGASVTKTTGAYDNANAGTSKTVSVALTTGDYSATGSTNLSNYTLPTSVSGNVGTISSAPVPTSAPTAAPTPAPTAAPAPTPEPTLPPTPEPTIAPPPPPPEPTVAPTPAPTPTPIPAPPAPPAEQAPASERQPSGGTVWLLTEIPQPSPPRPSPTATNSNGFASTPIPFLTLGPVIIRANEE